MKKKIFFQRHPIFVFGMSGVSLFFVLGGIFSIIYKLQNDIFSNDTFVELVIYFIGIIIFGVYFISSNFHRIVLNENYIYVPDSIALKNRKIQFNIKVKYEDIESIDFIRSIKNSKNQNIQQERAFFHHYIQLTLKNGNQNLIYVTYFSKKQKIKIIDEIILRMRKVGKSIDFIDSKEMVERVGMFGVAFIVEMSEKRKSK